MKIQFQVVNAYSKFNSFNGTWSFVYMFSSFLMKLMKLYFIGEMYYNQNSQTGKSFLFL